MKKHVRQGSSTLKRPRDAVTTIPWDTSDESGTGAVKDPFRSLVREKPNGSGCCFCPSKKCCCQMFSDLLQETFAAIPFKRQTELGNRRELCAKSILPVFVSRIARITKMDSDSVFYDFGCGNGSVLFQTAFMTGAKCVGFEINPINVKVAKEVWKVLRPKLEKIGGRSLDVTIECVDFCQYLKKNESFFQSPCVIWAANLLLPRPVNHYLSEQFRRCAVGTQILCFEDFYPHGRSLARLRDPEAFELFEMRDYVWPPLSVEWCTLEGTFYWYKRV